MMPHPKRAVRLLLTGLLAVLASAPSCQWAGDKGAVKVSYAALKAQLDDVSARLASAVQNGEYDRVKSLDRELNLVLDAAMKQSSAMNLLDREHLAINVATARRSISDMDRYATGGDTDMLKAQVQQLSPTVSEIRELLDRAERTTTAE